MRILVAYLVQKSVAVETEIIAAVVEYDVFHDDGLHCGKRKKQFFRKYYVVVARIASAVHVAVEQYHALGITTHCRSDNIFCVDRHMIAVVGRKLVAIQKVCGAVNIHDDKFFDVTFAD